MEGCEPARRGRRPGAGGCAVANRRCRRAGRRQRRRGGPARRHGGPRAGPAGEPGALVILEGKRIVVTGVVNRHSIAYAIAEHAQLQGAEVVLTSFGRVRRMTERATKGLPDPPDVLELDVNSDEDLAAL